ARGTAPAAGQPLPSKISQPFLTPPGTNLLLVRQFFNIPLERLKGRHPIEPEVSVHRWREGKLWLGLHYGHGAGAEADTAAVAWNPEDGKWDVFSGPLDRVGGDFEVFNGALYWISGWWEEQYRQRSSADEPATDSSD